MTSLTPRDFVELVNRDDVDFRIETVERRAKSRHEYAVPQKFAFIKYPDEGVGEVYWWQGETWIFQSFGWL